MVNRKPCGEYQATCHREQGENAKPNEVDEFPQKLVRLNRGCYGTLASNYNLLFGKPNVQFYEGIERLNLIYDDILEINQNISIISSPTIDEDRQEVLHIIKKQIEKQVAQNIKTRAITPFSEGQKTSTPISEDEKYLITRKIVPAEKLKIPAQIIIYGDKVAITNFKETIISVLIESKYITETFRIMFDYIWQHD